jgi:hypothetical protein
LGKRNEKKMYKKGNKSGKKTTWGKLQCFKEKDKKTKFSTSSIVKKIKSTKIIQKKQNKKKYVKNDNFGKKEK